VAQTYLKPSQRNVGWYVPKGNGNGSGEMLEDDAPAEDVVEEEAANA
jgi:hypothetical protein